MNYSNFNNYLFIFKILLCFYILLSPYIKHDTLLAIANDNGIKIFIILLILYFIKIDYTISLLLSICLIIMIILHNKEQIDNNKKQFTNKEEEEINEKQIIDEDILISDKIFEDEEEKNNILITENYEVDENSLEKIQTNIFNEKNNLIYFSGNYTNSLITAQGELDLVE